MSNAVFRSIAIALIRAQPSGPGLSKKDLTAARLRPSPIHSTRRVSASGNTLA